MKGRKEDPSDSLPGTSYPSCWTRYCGLKPKQKNTIGKGQTTANTTPKHHNHRGSTRFAAASYFLVPSSAREGRLNPPHVLGAGMKQALGGATKAAITEKFTLRAHSQLTPITPPVL